MPALDVGCQPARHKRLSVWPCACMLALRRACVVWRSPFASKQAHARGPVHTDALWALVEAVVKPLGHAKHAGLGFEGLAKAE